MFSWIRSWLGVGSPPAEGDPGEPINGTVSTDPRTLRGLYKRASHHDPEQRRRAAEQIGQVKDPFACGVLLNLLKDMFGEVRDAAREGLRKQDKVATAALIKGLEDADPRVAIPCADLLGDLKDLDAVRPLLLVMKFGTVEIRAAATRALIRYGRAAIPGLMLAIQDPDPWARRQGESILADIQANERAEAAKAAAAPAAQPQPPSTAPEAPLPTPSPDGQSSETG